MLFDELNLLLRKRQSLLSQLAALDLQISDVRARHCSLSNQSAPFFKLPAEIIIHIFQLCHTALPSFELLASHVCARWRNIALHLPQFWNTIDLFFRDTTPVYIHRRLQKLSFYLSRSHPLLLDVFISSNALDAPLSILIPHASRWRRLCLVTDSQLTQPIHQALHQLSVPALEYISIRTGYERDAEEHQSYPNLPSLLPQIFSSTSSLHFVRLAGAALWTLQPSLITVRTLHLEGCRHMHMTCQQFRTLMAALPSLVNLSLSQLAVQSSPENGRNPTLASLRHLRFSDEEGQPSIVMSLMDLPILESISLQNVESFGSTTRAYNQTQSIAFDACPLPLNDLWDVVQAFPSVTSLTMDQSVDGLYALLGFSGEVKWPDLETITIYDLIPINVESFCSMVRDRIQAGKPLGAVRLNRRSRTVLKNKGRLQWVGDQVRVENHDFEDAWPPGLEFYDPDDR